jgi:hypothetical protein
MEMSNIFSYYELKGKNVATLVDVNDNVEIQFKRFNSDTGEEMANALSHVPVSIDELNGMKIDYQAKINLIDDFITEVNNL